MSSAADAAAASGPPGNEELLRRCIAEQGGAAFRILVERHAPLVRATAWRQTGDFHAAEDIAQTVFCALLREAEKVKGATLTAWLHRRTLYEASHWRRAEKRRRRREHTAYERAMRSPETLSAPPELDAALNRLRPEDREMLLLRCVDRRDWRSIGAAMGLTEDTAQKCVTRALEKIRRALAAGGIVKTGSALTAVIAHSAAVPEAKAFASTAQLAAAALTKAATAAAPSSSAGGLLAGWGLPCMMLVAGLALPLAAANRHRVEAKSLVPPSRPEAAQVTAAPSAAGPVPDLPALRAMLREEHSPLDRLRVRRALASADGAACLALLTAMETALGARSTDSPFYAVLRNEVEEHWIRTDPRGSALSGYLRHNHFPERAVRYLAARDFAAAQSLAAELAAQRHALDGGQMDKPFYHSLVSGLASVDVHAALAFTEAEGFRDTALEAAADTQPEEVLRLIASEKPEYRQRELWKKALSAIGRTDPARALSLYRSRDFPDGDAQKIEPELARALMRGAPDLAEKELPRLRVAEPEVVEFLAKRNSAAGRARGWTGVDKEVIVADPAAAMKRWSPMAADPLEQRQWWYAHVRLGWVNRDTMPANDGGDRQMTAAARSAIREVLAGVRQCADSVAKPPEEFPGLLRVIQQLDPASAAEMSGMIPDRWGAAGVKIRSEWLKETGAAPDDIEREIIRTMTAENTAAGYFDLAVKRLQTKPASFPSWTKGLTGEARIGALAAIASHSESPNSAKAALSELHALNRPEHPLMARAWRAWASRDDFEDEAEVPARVAGLPRGPVFDAAAQGLSFRFSRENEPVSALQWAAQIGDGLLRQAAVTHALTKWQTRAQNNSPPGLREAFENLDVPEPVKRKLIQRFLP